MVHNMDGTHKDKATWTEEKESTKMDARPGLASQRDDGRLQALFTNEIYLSYACSG